MAAGKILNSRQIARTGSGEAQPGISRRHLLWTLGGASAYALSQLGGGGSTSRAAEIADPALAGRPLVRYPEKTDLILLTSRPPQLETPVKYFEQAITPNEAFYVRYHIYPPTRVDASAWRLKVNGHLDRPLELSLQDLQTK